MVKNPPANTGDIRDAGLIPGSGRYPGGGHGNPLQYSCLENPMDRGAWWATVKCQTRLKQLSMHALAISFTYGDVYKSMLLYFYDIFILFCAFYKVYIIIMSKLFNLRVNTHISIGNMCSAVIDKVYEEKTCTLLH